MAQDPYRSMPDLAPGKAEGSHPATSAATVALLVIVIAIAAFQDRSPGGNMVILGLLLSAVVLLAAWRAGKRR